jgi:hypothetical protein
MPISIGLESDAEFYTYAEREQDIARLAWITNRKLALVGDFVYVVMTSHLCTAAFDASVFTQLAAFVNDQLKGDDDSEEEDLYAPKRS